MNEPENNLESSSRDVAPEQSYAEVRRVLNLLFAAIILTSFTLTAYLGLQASRASAQLKVLQERADELKRAVQQNDAGVRDAFVRLDEFARTHPDFQKQVLSKYKITTNSPAAATK